MLLDVTTTETCIQILYERKIVRALTKTHCYTARPLLGQSTILTFSNIFEVSRKDIIATEMAQTYIVQLAILLFSIKHFCIIFA
jgi:hypothetical protein